jgi:glutathione synthase/RimK-type ligase-like ATP-grasp enzyme
MVPFEVPDNLDRKCKEMMDFLGLEVGAFDLIKTEVDWIFLEVNSTPSWNWMNPFVKGNIQQKIALELAHAVR